MSYRKTLERLRAYAPKRLIRIFFERRGDCCALGAVAPPGSALVMDSIAEAMGLSLGEAELLMSANDLFPGTPEQRYAHVLEWLEARVAAEGGAT